MDEFGDRSPSTQDVVSVSFILIVLSFRMVMALDLGATHEYYNL